MLIWVWVEVFYIVIFCIQYSVPFCAPVETAERVTQTWNVGLLSYKPNLSDLVSQDNPRATYWVILCRFFFLFALMCRRSCTRRRYSKVRATHVYILPCHKHETAFYPMVSSARWRQLNLFYSSPKCNWFCRGTVKQTECQCLHKNNTPGWLPSII